MKKSQSGFSLIIPIAIIIVLTVVGFAGYKVFQNNNENQDTPSLNNSDINQATSNEKTDAENPGSITNDNSQEHTLQENTSTIKITGLKGSDNNLLVNDPSIYATLSNPKQWPVYKYESDDTSYSGFPTLSIYVMSPSGMYIHLFRVDGVGGYCEPNDNKYTLVKKLPTNIENTYFMQYEYQSTDDGEGFLALRTLTSVEKTDYNQSYFEGLNKHNALQEGETNIDTCYTDGYNFVGIGNLYLTVRNDTKSDLGSNVSWDDIKDDQDLVDMLQSLSIN